MIKNRRFVSISLLSKTKGRGMFLKVSKVKGYVYVNLVYSYRTEDNKVKHKTMANLGRADKLHLLFPAFEKW